jgi:hypothetical protein
MYMIHFGLTQQKAIAYKVESTEKNRLELEISPSCLNYITYTAMPENWINVIYAGIYQPQ